MQRDPSIRTREDFYVALRRYMKGMSFAGVGIILAGALLLMPEAIASLKIGSRLPGFVVLGLGWGLFIYAAVQRLRWARVNRIEG